MATFQERGSVAQIGSSKAIGILDTYYISNVRRQHPSVTMRAADQAARQHCQKAIAEQLIIKK